MRRTLLILLVITIAAVPVIAQTSTAPKTFTPSVDEGLKALRSDLQHSRADLMAKNLTLTAEQAAKFWPMFEKYTQEQNVIIDDQLRTIQTFVSGYDKLDDAGALALLNGHLDRDAKMLALRKKWLPEFQKVLPAKLAVRAMQIDRRLSLAQQFEIAAHIPLAY
jgi:Spy/CpxP family protein refolding chaperone